MRASFRAVVSLGISAAMLAIPSGASLASVVIHAPRIIVPINKNPHPGGGGPPGGGSQTFGWASSNWSGYAVTGGAPYTSVTGTWIVPAVTASKHGSTYSSSWIGIDGFNNSNLIQTGTEQDYVNGQAEYYAWWEILPAPETQITGNTVDPGDHMYASVSKGSNGWTITINDQTKSWSYSPPVQAYSGPGNSAEWIEEAPSFAGQVLTLANYGKTTFDPGTVNGSSPQFTSSDSGIMVQHMKQVSTPSVPDSDYDGFNIAYGSNQPPPPTS